MLLLCVLANFNILKVALNAEPDANNPWIKFLTDTSVRSVRLLKMILAVILACPNLLPQNLYADSADHHQIADFFEHIRQLTRQGEEREFAPLNQFMLLVAIHLKTDNHAELSRLLSAELSLNVS